MSAAVDKRVRPEILMTAEASRSQRRMTLAGEIFLAAIAFTSVITVLFIILFIAKDAIPFFLSPEAPLSARLYQFFRVTEWRPTAEPPVFGVLGIMIGSLLVTMVSCLIAVPTGVLAAVCLSDVLPFRVRQVVKPVIEVLASIPSVAYGFFAFVTMAYWLQEYSGALLKWVAYVTMVPIIILGAIVISDLLSDYIIENNRRFGRGVILSGLLMFGMYFLGWILGPRLEAVEIASGTNALNVSIILAIMALPTIVSVAEDALQASGVEIRMASYGLGATRAETMLKAVMPAASSGICAAVILGVMRAIGETMVVWMAAGNASQIPWPPWNLVQPVRVLTATIAGDMGETEHGSSHYHCLFAMALFLLIFCLICNLLIEWVVRQNRKKLKGE